MSATDRVHALDALRAFALLLGIVLHSALPYVMPPGVWAVGTTQMTLSPVRAIHVGGGVAQQSPVAAPARDRRAIVVTCLSNPGRP